MSNPTALYKHPGRHKIHGGLFDYKVVDADTEEFEKALEDGWFLTTPEALAGKSNSEVETPEEVIKKVSADKQVEEVSERQKLEEQASELGIKFTDKTTDKTLQTKIDAALEA